MLFYEKEHARHKMKYWEIIADNLQQSRLDSGPYLNRGFSWANDLDC
jgi:hypothetical protein